MSADDKWLRGARQEQLYAACVKRGDPPTPPSNVFSLAIARQRRRRRAA